MVICSPSSVPSIGVKIPALLGKVQNEDQAATVLTAYFKSDVKLTQSALYEIFYFGENSPLPHFVKATPKVLDTIDIKLTESTIVLSNYS